MPEAVPVAIKGFDWGAAGWLTAAIALIGVLIRQWVPLRKVQADADASLREDLMKLLNDQHALHQQEVAMLKTEQAAERLRCSEDMAALRRESYEREARLEGEIKALRDQLLQLHRSTGAAIQLGGFNAPEANAAAPRAQRIARQRRQREAKGQ